MPKLPCPPELWPAFSALLDQALELPETARPAWLNALGPEHGELRPWLARVLEARLNTRESTFLEVPAVAPEQLAPEFAAEQEIGPYALLRLLGRGGMGEVWSASRTDGAINRQVALKLPHSHLLVGVLRRRFERERDILAGLSHANIAQLYDAGIADQQTPYLAMEWIDGVPINDYCRERKLSVEGRLDLGLQILDAIGYAHGRLIAHRDIKPSNILVTREGQVKLLDFGIAKLLDGEGGAGVTQLTQMGTCMATPDYAAPEQLTGEVITVTVDLYALGVVLFELLTGQRPFAGGRRRLALRADVPRASSMVEPDHAATVGGMTPKQLSRALAGDLDAILAKALEADPALRYRTAEAFARDILRSRQHLPISARRIGAGRLLLKFVQRHWIGAALTASLVLALIVGSVGVAWQAIRAEREAQRATAIKDFLVGVFRASDPRIGEDRPRGEITARALLDASAQRIESAFAQDPATQIELLGVTAEIYRELDETERSKALYAREAQLADKYLGSADVHVIDGLIGQAGVAVADGDAARALQLLGTAAPLIDAAHLERSPIEARWLVMRGDALMDVGKSEREAQSALEAAAALFEDVAPRDPVYPSALTDLGNLALGQFQFAAAATFYRQAIALTNRNTDHEGYLLQPSAGLALALWNLGDFAGAAAAFVQASDTAARTYGPDSHHYWAIASDWAQFRYERGERQAALAAFEKLDASLPSSRGASRDAVDALEAAEVLRKFGRCLAADGQGSRAVAVLQRAKALLTESSASAADLVQMQFDLGKAYEAAGRLADALPVFQQSLREFAVQNAPARQQATGHERLGRLLLAQNKLDDAAAEFRQVLRLSDPRVIEPAVYAQAGLASIALIQGDTQAALDLSEEAMRRLDHLESYFDVRVNPYVWGIRARVLLQSGATEPGRQLAERYREAVMADFAPYGPAAAAADALWQDANRRTAPTG